MWKGEIITKKWLNGGGGEGANLSADCHTVLEIVDKIGEDGSFQSELWLLSAVALYS